MNGLCFTVLEKLDTCRPLKEKQHRPGKKSVEERERERVREESEIHTFSRGRGSVEEVRGRTEVRGSALFSGS